MEDAMDGALESGGRPCKSSEDLVCSRNDVVPMDGRGLTCNGGWCKVQGDREDKD